MKTLASISSWIFHPIWLPPLAIFLFIEIDPYLHAFFPKDYRMQLFLLLMLNTVIAPLLSIVFLRRANVIRSIQFEDRTQRFWLYTVAIFYYCVTYFLWRKLPIPNEINSIFLGICLTLILAFWINTRVKLSAHTFSMAGVLGVLLALFLKHEFFSLFYLECGLILTGWIMSARLLLNAHVLKEVFVGFILGLIVMFGTIYFGFHL